VSVPALVVFAFIASIWFWNSLYVIKEWERGVVLRLGKIQPAVLGPGLRLIVWPVETLYRISMKLQTMAVVPQTLRAHGDVDVRVSATYSFRVADAVQALAQVQDYRYALHELVKVNLRDVVGKMMVDDVEYAPERISERVKELLEESARNWGLEIVSFEIRSEAH
jgi:regulator of protease activity HflC (stomatin/prohibitin superfamily)